MLLVLVSAPHTNETHLRDRQPVPTASAQRPRRWKKFQAEKAYLVTKDREERIRTGRVGNVPDQQGYSLVVLHAPLREILGDDGGREDVVAFGSNG